MLFEINGTAFDVGVVELKRQIEFYEKYRHTTEDGKRHRELGGAYKNYTLSIGNVDADAYDALMGALLSDAETQTVKIPDGKEGFVVFEAMFDEISDELMYEHDGVRHWDNLSVKFTAAEPVGGA